MVFCNHGKSLGFKMAVRLRAVRLSFCNRGKPLGSKTRILHVHIGLRFCNYGKSLGSKTGSSPRTRPRLFCNYGKSLGSKTGPGGELSERVFCNYGKSLGSKTDGPVFRVLPAVSWTPSDVKPRLFRPFATSFRLFSNGFSETFSWSQTITARHFSHRTTRTLPGKLPVRRFSSDLT